MVREYEFWELEKGYDKNRENNFEYDCGFVFPNGKFYGCCEGEHAILGRHHFKMNETEMDNAGYIRITEREPFTKFERKPTAKQIDTVMYFCEKIKADYMLKIFFNKIKDNFV